MRKILWGLLILLSLVVSGCGAGGKINGVDDGDGTGDGSGGAGFVNYTVPNDGATGIGRYADLFIVFNQAMNPLTVTDAAFSVVCGNETKNIDVSYDAANMAAKFVWPIGGGWGENNTCTVTARGGSLRTSANNLMGDDYVFTFSTSSGSAIAALNLSASKLTLDTNGTDKIDFTVYAKDANSAAASNATISVASTGGFLSANSVTTDATGQATFALGVGDEKDNRQISVTLTAGTVVKAQTITISGTTLSLLASETVTTPNDATPIELTATLRDAAGQPISDATISFTSVSNNTFTPSSGYVFTSGSTGKTDSAGLFKVKYTGTNTGVDTVAVASAGATGNVSLTSNSVSMAFFGFTVPANPVTQLNVNTLQNLTVKWLAADGAPKVGEVLTFYTTKGYFGNADTTMTTATTDASGLATLTGIFNTGGIAGPGIIEVYDVNFAQKATLTLDIRATTPASINLQVSPGVIPVSTINTTSTATLKATVRDANNQAVAGKVVGFSIFAGPGAGEFLSPVTAITDSGGIATSTFTSGSQSSAQDGVEVRATVAGITAPATAKMTIAQSAAIITIGTTNKLGKIGDTGYVQEFTVLVTDSSGGAVEGAIVSLSLVPLRFYTGAPQTHTGVFLSEDKNRNYILDTDEVCPQELNPLNLKEATGRYWQSGTADNFSIIVAPDVDPACTSNGRLDPGAVASIDSRVTTGIDGMGIFKVYYPKSFGSWVDVEITATSDVSGTNANAKIEYFLNVVEGDLPYLSSPFGLGEAL